MMERRDLSRRDFLASAALGVVACARGSENLDSRSVMRTDEALMYVGTYTDHTSSEGIYLVGMNRRTGQLRRLSSVKAGVNPSFLAIHPSGGALYAVNEVDAFNGTASGGVTAFGIASDSGALSKRNEQASGGTGPCFISVDRTGQVALVANYDGGSVALLPIQSDGSLARAAQVDKHTGSGPVKDRQAEAHAHCLLPDPTNRFALGADLGADRVFMYRLDPAAKSLRRVEGGEAVMRPGAGPRHLAFHPTLPFVYVANELDSTIATLRLDAERGTLSVLDTRSTLAAGASGVNYPAEIHVAPSGRSVYVSNRGHNSIAVFSIAESTGALTQVQVVSTDGDWPRNFTLDPSGSWLLVGNQRSDTIVVFGRDEQTGRLTPTSQRLSVPSPVCLRFR
jgi:6-phosphogluconolactonase